MIVMMCDDLRWLWWCVMIVMICDDDCETSVKPWMWAAPSASTSLPKVTIIVNLQCWKVASCLLSFTLQELCPSLLYFSQEPRISGVELLQISWVPSILWRCDRPDGERLVPRVGLWTKIQIQMEIQTQIPKYKTLALCKNILFQIVVRAKKLWP